MGQFVLSLSLAPSLLSPGVLIDGHYSSRRRRLRVTLRSKLPMTSSTRSGLCSAFRISKWSNSSTAGWEVRWTSSTLYVTTSNPLRSRSR